MSRSGPRAAAAALLLLILQAQPSRAAPRNGKVPARFPSSAEHSAPPGQEGSSGFAGSGQITAGGGGKAVHPKERVLKQGCLGFLCEAGIAAAGWGGKRVASRSWR